MHVSLLRRCLVAVAVVVAMVASACGDSDEEGGPGTTNGTVTVESGGTIDPTGTDLVEPSSTSTESPADEPMTIDWDLFPAPADMERAALDYCASWPDVAGRLAETVQFAHVPPEGWVPAGEPFVTGAVDEPDEAVVRGVDDATEALAATGFTSIDCGGPVVVSGDWAAIPVSASHADGTGEVGIWLLRVVDDEIVWHQAFGTGVAELTPASTTPDTTLAAEARSFCALVEGPPPRDAPAVADAMADDPGAHNIGNNLHYLDRSGIRNMVRLYSLGAVGCEETTTTNGDWSAAGTTYLEPPFEISLVGLTVQHHVDGRVHRQYFGWTQASGSPGWGLPVDE